LPVAGATPEPGAWQSQAPQPAGAAQQNWGSCSQFVDDTSDIPTAKCTTVSVPVDYNNPGGAQAKLAVIRVPATGERIGSLLVNPGGPGASAVDMAAGMAPDLQNTDITRHFDLVGFDPRGVGHSTPTLRCRTDAQFDAYRREPMVDYSPAGVAHIEQLYKQLVQECVNRMGSGFLANAGTASAARDMDMVRQALGDDQINYLGYSYGTELGTAYLERFSDRVRAMVLDGAIARPSARSRKTSIKWRDSRPRSTPTPRTAPARRPARWAPTRPNGSTATTPWSTRWPPSRVRRRIRGGSATPTPPPAPSTRSTPHSTGST
jgi:pimeloyl-ACP methyl ester carboxylesterase